METSVQRDSKAVHLDLEKIEFDRTVFRWPALKAQVFEFGPGDQRGMGYRDVVRIDITRSSDFPAKFELRYLELGPGGYASLERHAYPHVILVLRGRGKALVGSQVFDLVPHDLLFVPPDTPHRWINDGDEPFGLLCPVDAERELPQCLNDDQWFTLKQNPATAPYVF